MKKYFVSFTALFLALSTMPCFADADFDFMAAQGAEALAPAAWENTSPSAQPVEGNEEAVTTGNRSAYTAYNPSAAGNQTETESSSSYTSQKPFDEDGAIKQQFIIYKLLSGKAKSENDTEFTEWQKACEKIGKKNHVATFKLVKNAEDNNMIIYNCVADTCDKEGYVASNEWPICTKGNKQNKNDKKQAKATTELEKQYEKDIDELISAHEAVVKKYVKECTSKGGDIQDGACSK